MEKLTGVGNFNLYVVAVSVIPRMCIYIYIYIYMCVCVCVYMYIAYRDYDVVYCYHECNPFTRLLRRCVTRHVLMKMNHVL
jgi:hypothetical protein